MTSESEQPSPLEKLETLKRHQDELNRRIRELENTKKMLEDQFVSLEARDELIESLKPVEDIVKTNEFKYKFCSLYDERFSRLADMAELVSEILLTINVPNLTVLPILIPAMLAIKISKFGVEQYCKDIKK
jgi:predicted nuclease with TOPRIM domain